MKKTMMLVPLALLLAGCGGGGSDSAPKSPIVGRWRLTNVSGLGQSLSCPGSITIPLVGSASCSDHDIVQFNNDGTFSANGDISVDGPDVPLPTGGIPTNGSGNYQFNDNTLTVSATNPDTNQVETESAQVSFSGQNMTIASTQEDVTITSIFVKVP